MRPSEASKLEREEQLGGDRGATSQLNVLERRIIPSMEVLIRLRSRLLSYISRLSPLRVNVGFFSEYMGHIPCQQSR